MEEIKHYCDRCGEEIPDFNDTNGYKSLQSLEIRTHAVESWITQDTLKLFRKAFSGYLIEICEKCDGSLREWLLNK